MEREITYKKIRSIKELREFVQKCLIEHSEARTHAFMTQNINAIFYEQGWLDSLRTIRDVISKDGLMLYRYVTKQREKKERDKDRDVL